LEKEVLSLIAERDIAQIKINRQFSIQSARSKLNSHYIKVLPVNQKFKEI
jgi:CBS-domain-containing membrane protein